MPGLFVHYVTYLVTISQNIIITIPNDYQGIKMGITIRPIWYRLQEHLTPDERRRYFGAARFYGSGMTQELLFELERLILRKTKQYMLGPDSYNSECRYNVSPETIMAICISCYEEFCKKHENVFFELMNIDTALLERDDNCEEVKPIAHFKSLEDMETYVDLPKLKGYQVEAFEKMKNAFINRVSWAKFAMLLNIMCGYGKTILIQAFVCLFAREFTYVVYCTERLALIEDQVGRFSGIRDCGFYPLELSSSGSKYCKTDDEFKTMLDSNGKLIIFVAHKSFHRLAPLLERNERILFIFDEAHNLCREPSDQHPLIILNKLRTPKKIDDYTIYSTATKINGVLTPENTRIYMNDLTYFNVATIQYTDIRRGIEEEFICPFKLVVRTNVANICEQLNGQKEQVSMSITDRSLLINCINVLCSLFLDITLTRPPRKVVIYTNRTSRIEAIYSALTYLISVVPGLRDIKLYKLYSKSDRGDLKKFMDEKERCIMINCRILTEGIDCRDIDTIVFCDPKHSEQDIIQCIFRGCRFMFGKIAYIVFPVNEETFMVNNKLSTFRTTIRALIKYNDPNVTREMLSRSKSELSNGNQEFVKNETFTGHLIDESIKHKLLDVFASDFVIDGWEDAIKHVLSYKTYLTATEIFEEIEENKMLTWVGKTPKDTVNSKCGKLVEKGLIGRFRVNPKDHYKYYELSKPIIPPSISTATFVSDLKDQNIFTENDYRYKYGLCYDDKYVYKPEAYYINFTWDLLHDDAKNEYETFEQCKIRFDEIQQYDGFKRDIEGVIGNDKVWNIFMKYDTKIPQHPKKYNREYNQFSSLFVLRARR